MHRRCCARGWCSATGWWCRTARSSAATGSASPAAPTGPTGRSRSTAASSSKTTSRSGRWSPSTGPPSARPASGRGAKIDNLVQIGHGVKIGRNALLAAQVGIAGSTVVEDDVTLAGQVGVNGHITIGKGVRATGQTGITNDVPPGSFVSGLPAVENRAWRKAASSFVHLPALRRRVAALERRCAELEERSWPHRQDAAQPAGPEPEKAGE